MIGVSKESINYMKFQMTYYQQLARGVIKSMCESKGQAVTAALYQISCPAAASYQKGKLPPINKALQILELDTREKKNEI